MEIFVDVEVHHSKRICVDCKFMFHVFSRNWDVFYCDNGERPELVIIAKDHVARDIILGYTSLSEETADDEWLSRVIVYAADKGYIPMKFRKWVLKQKYVEIEKE